MAPQPPADRPVGPGRRLVRPGLVPPLAEEAALVESQLRPRPRAATRRPGRPTHGAAGLPELRPLPRRDHAAPGDAARRGRARCSIRPRSTPSNGCGASSKGLIFVACHVGNNEAIAAGVGARGWPLSGLADDSTFPELFEHLKEERSRWGSTVIPWRNLREVYGVLRRQEMLALLVDWGYRPDDIPVRLFGAWTTLPAGPGHARRQDRRDDRAGRRAAAARRPLPCHDGRADPGRVDRARRRSFERPRRSPTRSSGSSPRRRTSGTASSRCGPRPLPRLPSSRPVPHGWRPGEPDAPRSRARRRRSGRRRASSSWPGPCRVASWLACRLPEGLLHELTDLVGELWYRLDHRRARARPGGISVGSPPTSRPSTWPTAGREPPRSDPRALERLVRAAFRSYARYYLDVARAPALTPAYLAERLAVETPELVRGGLRRTGTADLPRPPLRRDRAPGLRRRRPCGGAADHADGDDRRSGPPGLFRPDPERPWDPHRRPARGPARDHGRPRAGRAGRASSGDRDLTGGGMPVRMFGAPTSLPLGPALVAIESGAPTYGVSVRRRPGGRYIGRLDPLDDPGDGLAPGAGHGAARDRGALVRAPGRPGARAVVGGLLPDLARPRGGRRHDRSTRPGGPPHPHPGLGRHVGHRGDPRPRRDRHPARRHRDHRPRADRRGAGRPGDRPRPRGTLRGRRRRGGHDPGRPPPGAVHRRAGQAAPVAPVDDRRDPRSRRPGRPGPPARPVPAVRPGVRPAPAARRVGPALPPRRARDVQSHGARPAGPRALHPVRDGARAGRRSATATPTPPRRSAPAGRRFRGAARTTCAGRSSPARPTPTAASTRRAARCRRSGGSSASTAATCATRSAGRVRRDGTGRDHGYPGGRARPPRYAPGRDRGRGPTGEDRARHAVRLPASPAG